MQAELENKTEIVQAFDKEDESQILKEIEGQIVQPYFYRFEKGGNQITGLSYAGVRYIAKKMAENHELLCLDFSEVTETETTYRGKAVIRNVKTGLIFVGMSEVDRKLPFAYILAYNKAERNGFRKHEPENAILQAHKEWESKPNAVKNVTPKTNAKVENVLFQGESFGKRSSAGEVSAEEMETKDRKEQVIYDGTKK